MGEQATLKFDLTCGDVLLHNLVLLAGQIAGNFPQNTLIGTQFENLR